MIEFDCCECKRHIVDVAHDKPPEPPLCGMCLYHPGWYEDPQLRKLWGMDDEQEAA